MLLLSFKKNYDCKYSYNCNFIVNILTIIIFQKLRIRWKNCFLIPFSGKVQVKPISIPRIVQFPCTPLRFAPLRARKKNNPLHGNGFTLPFPENFIRNYYWLAVWEIRAFDWFTEMHKNFKIVSQKRSIYCNPVHILFHSFS